jgi:hypothetical protein
MTNARNVDDSPLNAPDAAGDLDADTLRQLLGEVPPDRQDAVFDIDEVDTDRVMTDTELYLGESGPIGVDRTVGAGALELLEDADLRSDETSDPTLAAEEGLAWIPPVDPPVVPADTPEGLVVAAGFGSSARDVPYDADHQTDLLPAEDEFTDRVRDALRADAATSRYADALQVTTDGGTVWLRGVIDDIDDDDTVVAVVESVPGVRDVVNERVVEGL